MEPHLCLLAHTLLEVIHNYVFQNITVTGHWISEKTIICLTPSFNTGFVNVILHVNGQTAHELQYHYYEDHSLRNTITAKQGF